MRRCLFLCFFLFSIVSSCKKDDIPQNIVPEFTGSLITPQEAQEALDFHNKVRGDVKSPSLVWSSDLAKYAQDWADSLVAEGGALRHRPKDNNLSKNYGENLFYGGGKPFSPLDASKAWYDEIEQYSYAKISTTNFQKTGHYTQMVWKTTTAVGFGIARFGNNEVVVVANYSPAGNVIGEYPY